MIERNLYPALDFWVSQTLVQRQTVLNGLKADLSLANNDFAALPPEIQAGILAGLKPPGRPHEDEADAAPASKKKGSS